MVGALSVGQLFDSLAIRVNGPRAWEEHLAIDWVFTDLSQTYRTELTNGVLIQDVDPVHGSADLTVTLANSGLLRLLGGAGLDGLQTEGDTEVVARLLAVLDPVSGDFAIVTP
jgi:alkyl sulfatase BDS1-like metallo-beta-lactamase superfamily hydrolase